MCDDAVRKDNENIENVSSKSTGWNASIFGEDDGDHGILAVADELITCDTIYGVCRNVAQNSPH